MTEHTVNTALAGPCACRRKEGRHYCHHGVHVIRRLVVAADGTLSMPPEIWAPECCPICHPPPKKEQA